MTRHVWHEDCSRASHPSMCTCAQVPSSHLAPADRYSALWGIVAFLEISVLFFCHIPRLRKIGPGTEQHVSCSTSAGSKASTGGVKSIACDSHSMPLKAGKNRRGSLSERPPKPAPLYKSFSTPVGAYGRVADHARKAMFCRGPQKRIAEKRIEAKLRLAGAP